MSAGCTSFETESTQCLESTCRRQAPIDNGIVTFIKEGTLINVHVQLGKHVIVYFIHVYVCGEFEGVT